jgi:UDP-glucose 4-epimerase
MRLLVTGASGFVGRGLLPVLTAAAHAGIATGRTLPPHLPDGWVGGRRDQILAGAPVDDPIEAVVHLEVRQHVARPSPEDIAQFERVNVEGTRAWLDWATANGIRKFVYASSIKAVGSGPGVHAETDSSPADTPYGRSKAAAEAIVQAWSRAVPDRKVTILRPAPVYGPGNEANLAAFVRQILRGKPCFVGDGVARKSVVARGNMAAAIVFCLGSQATSCEVYNVADAEIVSVRELAGLIAEIAARKPPKAIPASIASVGALAGDLFERISGRPFPLTTPRLHALREETVFPCDKLIAAGFRHPLTLRQGLAEMVAWAQAELAR